MSVSAMASLRPLQGRCLRRATTGLLSVRVRSRAANLNLQAVVALPPAQKRHQSGSSGGHDGPAKPARPQMTFRRFVGRALGASLRNLAVALSPRGIRSAYRDSPGTTTMNVALLLFLVVLSVVAVRSYVLTFYNAEFSRYPEPVANTLRRAIYYTNIKPEPELALRYYKRAMEQCAEVGLDPFSEEVLGIRIQVSFWLQKINSYKSAIDVLESVLDDCNKWVAVMEQSVKDGRVDGKGRYLPEAPLAPAAGGPQEAPSGAGAQQKAAGSREKAPGAQEQAPGAAEEKAVEPETLWRKRERLLAKAIGTSVKLGELYADEHVLDPEKSHARLLWAVETSLEEFRRRKTEGPRPGEETWLTPEQLGGSMESLGRDYERRSQFQLAIPLFFQALRLCDSPCHRAVIMNNLAAAFAQHPIYSPGQAEASSEALKEVLDSAMPTTRGECLDAALNWARNAYVHARDVEGEARTPECDEACAVALCNWGDVAAMLGKTELARDKYRRCVEMSQKMDFPQGVKQAQDGLARLTSTPSGQT